MSAALCTSGHHAEEKECTDDACCWFRAPALTLPQSYRFTFAGAVHSAA
jgi:hypothetical protein